jgi:hypothetical protein
LTYSIVCFPFHFSSVESMGRYVFKGSGLVNITVPSSVIFIDEVNLTVSISQLIIF